jgi:hypothetical protein
VSDYNWEDLRDDEEAEVAYAEEREREADEAEDRKQQAKRDAFDAGFAEYEAGLPDA